MDRRSFLAGLFGVAAAGTLVGSVKSSDAIPLLTGAKLPSAVPANDALATPDGTTVGQAAWGRGRRVVRRTYRRSYRRDYYRYGGYGRYGGYRAYGGGYYGAYGGYNHYGGYSARRVCGTFIDRYGYRRTGCRYVDDYY
jgi:hypothetical protein